MTTVDTPSVTAEDDPLLHDPQSADSFRLLLRALKRNEAGETDLLGVHTLFCRIYIYSEHYRVSPSEDTYI